MIIMEWFKRVFVPPEDFDPDESPRLWTERARIVLAALFVILSGCVIWWILA